jgi:serine/threonine-protein kinase
MLLDNRYQIVAELGEGGFGKTVLAEDIHMPSRRKCVIKQLKPRTNDPQVYQLIKERFQREAALLEALGDGCPQIPRLYAYFELSGEFYLVQEWIPGETLAQKVQRSRTLSESEVKEILLGILPVLDYIHSQGKIHRDLKPENIILRQADSKPVLIDFGAVKETFGTVVTTGGNLAPSIIIGTPGYMPSEQSIGRPVFASDLYSLGLTAIYALTGQIPSALQADPNTGEILWRHYAVNVSPALAGVLDKAIQSHWRDRYLNAKAMLEDLQRGIVPLTPTVAVNPPTLPPTQASEALYPQPQPTVPVAITQPVVPQPVVSATPATTRMKDWQKALIIGSVTGAAVVGGLVASRIISLPTGSTLTQNPPPPTPVLTPSQTPNPIDTPTPISTSPDTSSSTPTPLPTREGTSNPTPTPTPTPTPIYTPTPTPPPTPVPPATSSLSQEEARDLIARWQTAKRTIFGPPYDRELGTELTTGEAYRNNIQGPNSKGELSSREWLQQNNSYYQYGVQRIDSIERFEASENNATIEVVVTERRTLYNRKGKIDRKSSGLDTLLVRYNLQLDNDKWKISNYETIKPLRKS